MPRLRIEPAVLERFSGYTAAVVYAHGLDNGDSGAESSSWLRDAEARVRASVVEPASAHPHLAAWRSAFSAFGAKPSKFLCSAEALVKRVLKGEEIPPINRVVDAYNAVSLRHVLPAGGEDLDRLESDLTLAFADGSEPFDLLSGDGTPEHPDRGEIVWKDSAGVTCRRWNWRQCRRTRLVPETKNAYFVIDRLAPYPRTILERAADELSERLRRISAGVSLETEFLGARD
ncbi:MAG TPA: phenylalanine--tRNA ligase beta subunit-related protein [Thermoanaerobaculia bacterium]|nr:phenylalanine--tRNA ligase beta subunit-related protein [Thermoanaerobaculia bacterium]